MVSEFSDELKALRIELIARILMQNALLMLAIVIFAALIAMEVVFREQSGRISAVHATCSMGLLLLWCHHGVRTMQIKRYVMMRESSLGESWESWLPKNRPQRFLGTRWWISTKGCFLTTQAMALVIGIVSGNQDSENLPFFLYSLLVWVVSAVLLITNPKE